MTDNPTEDRANKAIMAALTTISGVVAQYLTTGSLELSEEGVTAFMGAVATLLVYGLSNRTTLVKSTKALVKRSSWS